MIGYGERLRDPATQWRVALKQFAAMMRVACPAIIQSFDPDTQTVTVILALRENVEMKVAQDGETPIFNRRDVQIKPLLKLPIVIPRAGGFLITLPIQKGDECLVVFGDMCIDGWWQSGGVQNQIERRRHDLSDGFAILGCWSQPRLVTDYSTDSAQVRTEDGTVVVELTPDELNLTAPTINLNADHVNITGNDDVTILGNDNTKIEGKVFLQHKHTDVQTGSSDTGEVA